jgi:hypothetical protein
MARSLEEEESKVERERTGATSRWSDGRFQREACLTARAESALLAATEQQIERAVNDGTHELKRLGDEAAEDAEATRHLLERVVVDCDKFLLVHVLLLRG